MYFSTFSGIKYLTELPLFNWSLMYVDEISKTLIKKKIQMEEFNHE